MAHLDEMILIQRKMKMEGKVKVWKRQLEQLLPVVQSPSLPVVVLYPAEVVVE